MKFSLNEIIYELGATVVGVAESQELSVICTDSRKITAGCLFIALRGEQFDGHAYAAQALKDGALAVVVEDSSGLPLDRVILVKNTRLAYLQIAGLWRRKRGTKVVAITGSVGKTTTKEMTACVLGSLGRTLKTTANLNNEVGLAEMLLQMTDEDAYAVLEIGVDGSDQMLPMALAAAPDVAVITNIGDSHREAFGSRERILKEKLDLIKGLVVGGKLLLNGDDPLLIAKGRGVSSVYYGLGSLSAEIQGRNIDFHENATTFQLYYQNQSFPVELPTLGLHNVSNALAAFGVGIALGIVPEQAIKALECYKPEGMRQRISTQQGYTLVEDCYNASPQSMAAALETLKEMHTAGRKILLVADMLELGDLAETAHTQLGEQIVQSGVDALFVTGTLAELTAKAAEKAGLDQVVYKKERPAIATVLKAFLQPGDLLWVKASRGMRLEEVLARLTGEGE